MYVFVYQICLQARIQEEERKNVAEKEKASKYLCHPLVDVACVTSNTTQLSSLHVQSRKSDQMTSL